MSAAKKDTRVDTRLATIADLDLIAPLFDAYRQFYDQPADLALARRYLGERFRNGESAVLLAFDGAGQAVGFCQLYPTFCSVEARPVYSLYDLFVTPAARRIGAGRALLQAAERLAQAHGKARMDLTTARTNLAAQRAYEAMGWDRDEVFMAYRKTIASPGG